MNRHFIQLFDGERGRSDNEEIEWDLIKSDYQTVIDQNDIWPDKYEFLQGNLEIKKFIGENKIVSVWQNTKTFFSFICQKGIVYKI